MVVFKPNFNHREVFPGLINCDNISCLYQNADALTLIASNVILENPKIENFF